MIKYRFLIGLMQYVLPNIETTLYKVIVFKTPEQANE